MVTVENMRKTVNVELGITLPPPISTFPHKSAIDYLTVTYENLHLHGASTTGFSWVRGATLLIMPCYDRDSCYFLRFTESAQSQNVSSNYRHIARGDYIARTPTQLVFSAIS